MRALPELDRREQRTAANLRYGTALTEGLLMTSRNGVHFERWNEAFLRPGPERPATWLYGHQFITSHAVETESSLPGAPREMSLYAAEGSWHGKGNSLRRYTLRLDGFVSINAPLNGGELLTKPLTFAGDKLTLNFATSAAGDIRVELQDAAGTPHPGFTLADCSPLFGDTLNRAVNWKTGSDVSRLAGQTVRIRFVLRDADLYAMQFVGRAADRSTASLNVTTRQQVKAEGQPDQFRVVEKQESWNPAKTAVIIIDMWDTHSCRSAAQRVVEMAPHANRTISAARDIGALIIHAPSDCMDFYKEAPQRRRALDAPLAESTVKFQWNYFNSDREGPLADKLEKGGCSCDTPEPCGPSRIVWHRQIDLI